MFIPIATGRGKGDLVSDFRISDMGFQTRLRLAGL